MKAKQHRRTILLLGAIALALVALVPVVTRAARPGPATDVLGAEPGSEKSRLIEQAQREFDKAAAATLGPVRGRPAEAWHPKIVEGILEDEESPFEGTSFELTNLWQSRLSPDGRVTRVYAGTRDGRSLLIVLRQVLQTGERELYREIELPRGVGTPRLTRAANGILDVATAGGRAFRLDVERQALR